MRRGEERALARGIEYAGSKIRKVFPDFDDGAEIVGITDSDRGVVRLSTGDEITMPFSPRGASAIGLGAKGRIQFVRRGNRQFPLWRTCCEGNGRAPVIAEEYAWTAFRRTYARDSRQEGSVSGAWLVDTNLFPTVVRFTQDSRWERRGSDGLWSTEPPWQLYRDGVAVGDSDSILWHDLSIVNDSALGLAAEGEGDGWYQDPDYPLPSETSRLILFGSWEIDLPNYEEEDPGGGDDGGGDDGGGGIIIG